jgi:hypothetical protein
MTTQRIESRGSYWEIDEEDLRYRRWPKYEGPRENPEWGKNGVLQDAIWHPFVRWEYRFVGTPYEELVIVIREQDDGNNHVVRAPMP